MTKIKISLQYVVFGLLFFSACLVQSPKYSSLEKVMRLQVGMTKVQVENILCLEPYNIKLITDTCKTFVYVYRMVDRKTLSIHTNTVNGSETLGKYTQLFVSYNTDDKVVSIESCITCEDNLASTKKVDVQKVIAFVTVTVPVLLIYFGLKE